MDRQLIWLQTESYYPWLQTEQFTFCDGQTHIITHGYRWNLIILGYRWNNSLSVMDRLIKKKFRKTKKNVFSHWLIMVDLEGYQKYFKYQTPHSYGIFRPYFWCVENDIFQRHHPPKCGILHTLFMASQNGFLYFLWVKLETFHSRNLRRHLWWK